MFTQIVKDRSALQGVFREAYEIAQGELNRDELVVITVAHKTRSNDQNAKMWAMLRDISEQVDWYGSKLTDDEWKDVLTAALRKEKVVPGIGGGFVVLGRSTSRMTISEMRDLTELMQAFGNERGVKFRAPKWLVEER